MIDNEVSFTSLCYITVDYEGRIWLNRLADTSFHSVCRLSIAGTSRTE